VDLTFDDGPDAAGTPDVLRALAAAGARGTFYVVAPRAAARPDLLAAVVAAGHGVELHCHDHVRHSAMTRAEVERDTDLALETLARLGVHPFRWRTPWGDTAPWTADVAERAGLRLEGWSADTHDWRGDRADEMLARLRAVLRPGDVVLMHDGLGPGARRGHCRETAALVGPLVAWARARGWMPAVAA
jgi:peptidoglycan/xylan/chitin deacetylase (PgdA/CDA1 family)